jgi:hypothetical protein
VESAVRKRHRGIEVERVKVLIAKLVDIHNYYV